MTFPIEAYTPTALISGAVARPERLREVLEAGGDLLVERCRVIDVGGRQSNPGSVRVAVDDLVLVLDDEATFPIHANWHALRLAVGPYLVEGELPTLPGFDPGRALTRPTGDFVLLRDATVRLRDHPDLGAAHHQRLLVNRYAVEVVEADLLLGFFFPGASVVPQPRGAGIAGD